MSKNSYFIVNYTGGIDITEAEDHTEIALREEGIIAIFPLEQLEKMIKDYRQVGKPLPEGSCFSEVWN